MNVLPLVFAFILIFSFLTSSWMQEVCYSVVSEKSLKGLYLTSRLATNAVAKKRYDRIKIPPPSPNPTQQQKPTVSLKSKPRKVFSSRRVAFPPLENSKFNFFPLLDLKTEPKNHILYEICADLLRELYEEPLFKQTKREGIEYDLLNAMLKTYRTKSDVKAICDLYPDDADLKLIFYKMLKGTNQYDLRAKRGIPPIDDFFVLEKGPAIHFAFASIPMLDALFGAKATSKILAEEKKNFETSGKNASLTQDELTALLSNDPARASIILELGQYMDFSQKYTRKTTLSKKNKISGLLVKKKI